VFPADLFVYTPFTFLHFGEDLRTCSWILEEVFSRFLPSDHSLIWIVGQNPGSLVLSNYHNTWSKHQSFHSSYQYIDKMSSCPIEEPPRPLKEKTKDKQSAIYRLTMPHVITQFKPGQFSRDGPSIKERIRAEKRAGDAAKSSKSPLKKQSNGISPGGASMPVTPKSKRWDFGTIRHKRQASSEVTMSSPRSAVSPVFEMEHIDSAISPNSSVDSSPWVFELEDTSQIALHSKRSIYPGPQLEFQSSAITVSPHHLSLLISS
jgi:hypothetical protein